uniref:Uncharacterized protein n=1 Tax=Chromera velia CCMP2878 TaxID=1169474 RepID=A0A0G4H725_9ALVE|eukprot:Cvel_24959.t1-p1 / transcript=Cvel_24959.t1 / gene=Cvel_24959 / organism=Chromera_velia_CCMP2878 / gene_product=hypothetical protein / transcript_product=hypothetical protein / location=Cvel_scaffold2764:4856-6884(+) / protein_length=195 / sequence_SO=supercontig / SO=protein_coding / is_pseudo=false
MPSSAFAKYFLPLSHDQRTAYSRGPPSSQPSPCTPLVPRMHALAAFSWCQYLCGGSGSCCCCFFFSVLAATLVLYLSAVKNQSLPFRADAEAAEEDDVVRCESPRGGAGGRAEGGYKWREEGEEEEDEGEDEEKEAWREEEEEEEEEEGEGEGEEGEREEGEDKMGEEAEDDERAAACLPILCVGLSSLPVWFGV